METKLLPINLIEPNTGQIPDVPENPVFVKDKKFKALVKSIKDFPEMLELREAVVYPINGIYVVIGGNQRYQACKHSKHTKMLCKILPVDFPAEKMREFVIKDNMRYGEDDHDKLANWDLTELLGWEKELPVWADTAEDYADKNKEIDVDDMESDMSIKLKYTEADYWLVKEALRKIASTPEQAVYKLLGL